jgi:hypothetical protein
MYKPTIIKLGHHLMPGIAINAFPTMSLYDAAVAGLFWIPANAIDHREQFVSLIGAAESLEQLIERIDAWTTGKIPFIAHAIGNYNYDVAYVKQTQDGDVWEIAPLVRNPYKPDGQSNPWSNMHKDLVPSNIVGAQIIRA